MLIINWKVITVIEQWGANSTSGELYLKIKCFYRTLAQQDLEIEWIIIVDFDILKPYLKMPIDAKLSSCQGWLLHCSTSIYSEFSSVNFISICLLNPERFERIRVENL